MSKLIDNNGIMECTGNQLTVWVKDFKRYSKMNNNERNRFMVSFSDSERFVDLFNKWEYVDIDGNRPNFTCGYTSQIFSTLPDNRMLIPDPMQVKSVERQLNRSLTEDELSGQTPISNEGLEIKLDMMIFPDDF